MVLLPRADAEEDPTPAGTPAHLVVGSEVGGIFHFTENGKIPITVNGYSACAQLGQPLPSQGTHPGGARGCERGSLAPFQDVLKDSICSTKALRHIRGGSVPVLIMPVNKLLVSLPCEIRCLSEYPSPALMRRETLPEENSTSMRNRKEKRRASTFQTQDGRTVS